MKALANALNASLCRLAHVVASRSSSAQALLKLHVLLWLFLAKAQLAQMQIEAEAALLEVTETAV